MKKNFAAILLVGAWQAMFLVGGIWLSVHLRSDCSPIADSKAMWQCTTNTDPTTIPLIAFAILPPILAKGIFTIWDKSLSWRRVIIIHITVGILFWMTLNYLGSPGCGCGGA